MYLDDINDNDQKKKNINYNYNKDNNNNDNINNDDNETITIMKIIRVITTLLLLSRKVKVLYTQRENILRYD